jgi:hypothetical protein
LPRAGHQSGTEQYKNVPPHTGMLDCVQYVGAGATPGKMLHQFEEPGQRSRSYPRSNTGKKYS